MSRHLPRGTVTFLFTDVEGSTKLLRELKAEGYAAALVEHRRLIREACSAHGGVEVDTQGDAFFFAFPTAFGALAAAQQATEAFAAGPIQVRIGVHTGTPLVTEEGYVGDDVHFAARVAASGHGGQVLVSSSTAALVQPSGSEPQALPLLDLGEHRLKDIEGAVSILQVGDGSFPPLKTISNTNLPRPASSFVGRESALAEVLARVQDGARLVTLTGPGGSGKTRLAIEAAASLVPEYKAGVFWVGLASLRDPAFVTETISQTLGAKDGLQEHIGERELLLLLDNLEQVIEAAPELSVLLAACPNLTLLVTSRELLRVQGEVEYPVPPLAEPEAVSLFCERAQQEPSAEIAELCTRLDSLPLAVELAAARTKALSPAQILERLSQRLDLLKGGRDADPRQQTLRATIEWSYDLLPPEEQVLFRRIAVFVGGCTLEAAEEVVEADLDTLQSLVEKSLVRFSNERYWMLETIREYAGERLEEPEEASAVRRRLALWVLAFAHEASPHLASAQQAEWLGRVEAEHDNVRTALEWAIGSGEAELALEVAGALGRFWWVRGPAEGLAWLERALEQAHVTPVVRADALDAAGASAYFVNDLERALALFEEGLAIFRELGDRAGTARMLSRLAPPLLESGRVDEAQRLVEEAVSINRELGQTEELALSLSILGGAALERGDPQKAHELMEESAALAHAVGDSWQLAWGLHNLADLALRRNDPARAWSLGWEALALAREIGDDLAVLICLGILSTAAARRGQSGPAGWLWGAAERLDDALGTTIWRRGRAEYEEMRGEQGPEFELGVEKGRRVSLEEAIALASGA